MAIYFGILLLPSASLPAVRADVATYYMQIATGNTLLFKGAGPTGMAAATAFDQATANALKGAVEILDWSIDISRVARVAEGAGTGKPNFSDLAVTRHADEYTPALYAHATGADASAVTITIAQIGAKGKAATVLTFKQVFVSSFALSGTDGELPVENLTFNYGAMMIMSAPATGSDSTVNSASWNIVTNQVT